MTVARELIFVLGGARSGKSTYVETRARQEGESVLFVATAEAFDDDMRDRIARHRADRPASWHTLEAPRDLGSRLTAALNAGAYDTVVVDCVTLLASNTLLALPDDADQNAATSAVLREVDGLLAAYAASEARWLVVSNEVGMGIVPPTRLGRLYRDTLGRANQRIAAAATDVLLIVAGLPWRLKP